MVIEHLFVTTLDAAQALDAARSLLSRAGFVDSVPTSPVSAPPVSAPPVSGPPGRDSAMPLPVIEMVRAGAGPQGSVPCPQKVRVEYDRGRITIAASIEPTVRRRSSLSAGSEVTGSSVIGKPFADAMMALAMALNQALANSTATEPALEHWKALDVLLTGRLANRRTQVRRGALIAALALAVISVAAAVGRVAGSRHFLAAAGPTTTFPENEDPRAQTPAENNTFALTSLEQLKAEAEAELQHARSHPNSDVLAVFAYADRLARMGAAARALRIYDAALKCAPSDYAHRLSYVDLLNRQKQSQTALSQARIVLSGAEDVTLLQKAQAIVGGPRVEAMPLAALPGGKPILVLVPMGDVDLALLEAERMALADELRIDVQLRSAPMSFPVVTRNPMKEWADKVRADLDKVQKDHPEQYANALQALGMTKNDLSDDVKAVSLAAFLMRLGKQPEAAARLEALGSKSETQWLADGMVEGFTAAVHPFARSDVRFLGITRSDMYGDNADYLYSYRVGDYGIVSYHRFTASFTNEVPDRTRLKRRLHLQLLACAGHVFGVEPCSDPTCPRGNTCGLADHDAKSDKLCDKCRKGFDAAFARSAAR